MCQIRTIETTFPDGYKSVRNEEPILCSRSQDNRPCSRTQYRVQSERSTYTEPSVISSSSRRTETVVHQPQERYFSPNISIGFRGWHPTYSIRRSSRPHSEDRRLAIEGPPETYPERRIQDVPPRAPMPPPATSSRRDHRLQPRTPPQIRSAPAIVTSFPSSSSSMSRSPTYTTVDTAPSSSRTSSVAPSSRDQHSHPPSPVAKTITRYRYPDPVSRSASTSRSVSTTQGLSRLRSVSRREQDSAYCSSNMSPVDDQKPDIPADETRSPRSKPRFNELYNYTNDYPDEDEESLPSRPPSILRVGARLGGNPEDTFDKMQQDLRAATDYQSQTSWQSEDDEGFEEGNASKRRHRKRKHGRRHDEGRSAV